MLDKIYRTFRSVKEGSCDPRDRVDGFRLESVTMER